MTSASARARVQRRAQSLLAVAATVALAGYESAGCGNGYGVVDPMPSPACPGIAGVINVTATWKQQGSSLVIGVVMTRPADRKDIVFSKTASATGGKVLTVAGGDSSSIDIAPDQGATTVKVSLTADCAQGTQNLTLTLTPGATPTAGAAVTATLTEGYGG